MLVNIPKFLSPREVVVTSAIGKYLALMVREFGKAGFKSALLDRLGVDEGAIEIEDQGLRPLDNLNGTVHGMRIGFDILVREPDGRTGPLRRGEFSGF
ncbi:MAG: hypothetical protein HYY68_05485 [Thaumarchaeota archaeon]|nr:hypothetical protein [Nitrososphaerota archaeon]